VKNLSQYELLYLPGWNTMTPELYEDLIAYVRQGGHLVLCAAQCTEHITRKFLLDKKDFRFINGGDLSALAGVKVSVPDGIINTVHFADEDVYTNPGVPGLQTELCGGKAIAVDQDGNPVVVENRIGSGKVWMLTVGEYWGHDYLDALRRAICRKAAMEHLVQQMEKTCGGFDNETVFIAHGDCPEDAAALEAMLREAHPIKEVITGYVGPVIGAHTGPGVLVVFFMGTAR
jgi:hypothetical protein